MNRISAIIWFLFASCFLFGQSKGSIGKYIFPEYTPITVPDSLSGEEAFYISNVTTYDFLETFETQIVVFQRVYINSEAAAEEFSKREFYLFNEGKLSILKARTIKQNGDIINLEGDQIITTKEVEKNQYGSEMMRRFQLIYPDVQVGDVVDIAYEIDLDRYIFSNLLYLEGDLPSLYSRITLRNMSRFDLAAYTLNSMPSGKSRDNHGYTELSWERKGVGTMETDFFNALKPTNPFAAFVLWKPGENLDYKTIYAYDAQNFPESFEPLTSISKLLLEMDLINPSDPPLIQLKEMIEKMSKQFVWEDERNVSVPQTMESFRKKKIDQTLFIRYVMKFLKEKKIKYEKGFTKSLLDGPFEHGLVTFEQLTRRYLLIYDENDQPHFLFPPTEEGRFYRFDEIPYYLEENQSIVLYGEDDHLQETGAVLLPSSNQKTNVQQSRIMFNFDPATNACSVKRNDLFKGHFSFLVRAASNDTWLEELGVKPDSVEMKPTNVKDVYPFDCNFERSWDEPDFSTDIGDSLMMVSFEKFLPKGVYQEDELDEKYGSYLVLPFLKKNRISMFIQSPNPLAVVDEEAELIFGNEVGSISIKLLQINETTVKFDGTFEVKKRFIENESEVDSFKDLLRKHQEFCSKKWVLKSSQ